MQNRQIDNRFNFTTTEYFTNTNFEHFEGYGSNLKQEIVPVTTAQEDEWILESRFNLKQNQNLANDYQISFQNDFMAQHKTVFKRQVQNYMESVRIHLQQNGQNAFLRFPEGLYNLKTNMTCQELVMMIGMELSKQMKNKFMSDLKFYDKLSEFLNIVADQCPAEIAIEMIQISQQILEEFLESGHKDNDFVGTDILLEIASSKCRNLKNINLLNLAIISSQSSEDNELMTKYQNFIEIYCATTILVIAQYFQNPYHQENQDKGFKRSLDSFSSDEEEEMEQINTKPQKKRKFSF